MSRPCTVCTHDKRAEIELSVANGASNRRIASQYGMSEASVRRHMSEHPKQAAKEHIQQKQEAQSLDVIKQLKDINTMTLEIMQAAYDAKKHGMALFAIDRVIKQIELQAKLVGSLDNGPHIDIHVDPQWLGMRELIFRALQPYPEALRAVARAMHEEAQRGRLVS